MNTRRLFFRVTSVAILVAFVSTTSYLECLVFADNFLNTARPQEVGLGFQLQAALDELQAMGTQWSSPKALEGMSDKGLETIKKDLTSIEDRIFALDLQAQKEFELNRKILSSSEMPPIGLERYEAFVKEYEARKIEVIKTISAAKDSKTLASTGEAFEALKTVAEKYSRRNTVLPTDMDTLPVRSKTIKQGQEAKKSGKELQKEQQSFSYAQALAVNSAPTADDLAETEDIVFHEEIIEAATQLNKNPIRMFRLVADNCYYQPYYGSMKGALETFRQQAGNDIDLASFLMAMYRYCGIPCRYVVGWIDIPMDQALNYFGVESINVLSSVIGTQRMPSVIMTNSDTGEQFLRMKRYWVKAWLPSKYRGVGGGNSGSWIFLDPAYRQHVFSSGIDTNEVLEADSASQKEKVDSYIVANSDYSFNFDLQAIRLEMNGYNTKMTEHFESAFTDDPAVQEVLNYMDIVREDFDIFPASLPYIVLSVDDEYSTIPSNMRFKVTINLKKDDPYDPFSSGVDLSYSASTAFLAGKRTIVAYVPASSSDASVIAGYGGVKNTPASAARLKPLVRIDGQVMKEGSGFGIGEEEEFEIAITGPDGTNDRISNVVVVGSYHGVAFDMQGVAPKQAAMRAEALKANVAKVNALVDDASGQQETVEVDRDELAGEFLSLAGMIYWSNLMNGNEYGAMQQNVLYVKGVSEAVASFGLQTEYFFGLPRNVDPEGTGIDVDINVLTPFNRKGNEVVNYDFSDEYGYRSSVEEHSVFDELLAEVFGTTTGTRPQDMTHPFLHQTEAENYPTISAVKALRVANEQGIPIYSLDSPDAYNAVKGELQLSSGVGSDVVNAVNSGKVVIVHQKAITFYDWHGFGYIIRDPDTGDGAYKISGGSNGGSSADKSKISGAIEWLFGPGSEGSVIATGLYILSQLTEFLGKAIGVIGIVWTIVSLIIELKNAEAEGKYCPEAKEALINVLIWFGAISLILGIVGLFVGPLMAFVIFIIGMYLSLAIEMLKAILPIICNYIDALNNVKLPDPRRILYGWLDRLEGLIDIPLIAAG